VDKKGTEADQGIGDSLLASNQTAPMRESAAENQARQSAGLPSGILVSFSPARNEGQK